MPRIYFVEINSCYYPLELLVLAKLKGCYVEPFSRKDLVIRSKLALARLDSLGNLISVEAQVYPKVNSEGQLLPRVLTASIVNRNYIEVAQCPVYFNGEGTPVITSKRNFTYWQSTRLLNLQQVDE
jgi:hypothetical protein